METNKTTKITKEEYLSLYDENISKKNYDTIISKIDARFYNIIKGISTRFSWFDYDNENGECNKSGYFEPKRYKETDYISFSGSYSIPLPYSICDGIPIRWLWEDYEEEFKSEVKKEEIKKFKMKEIEKTKRGELKDKKSKIKEIIRSKLTKEELKFIEFK